jgi:magnesium transporter
MTTKVPTVRAGATIGDVEKMLLGKAGEFDTLHYIYVLDPADTLIGVLSVREVFRSAKDTVVDTLAPKEMHTVRPHTDQEHAAYTALKHNLKGVPVVDKEHKFLGVFAADTIMHVIDREAVEDILRFGGVVHHQNMDDVMHLSLWKALRHRLPWLIIGLFGGLLTATILKQFEETLSQNLILAAFIPLVVYMAAAVSMQMEAYMIRDLALETKVNFFSYFMRQTGVVFVIALIVSGLLTAASYFMHGQAEISAVLGIALFGAVMSSVVTGLAVPFLFSKLRLDPANASGPVATIIQDTLSILVYFGVAVWLL